MINIMLWAIRANGNLDSFGRFIIIFCKVKIYKSYVAFYFKKTYNFSIFIIIKNSLSIKKKLIIFEK